jgi:two-component system nitrate/nitrite response regulator NarL
MSATQLTDRHREVLDYIAKGYTNKQIGDAIGLAEKTVKAHVTAIFKALNVNNRTEAAMWVKGNAEHCQTCTCRLPANAP